MANSAKWLPNVDGTAKAWVNAANNASISDSFNVSSSTDHGTGDFSYTMSNAMASVNYAQSDTGQFSTSNIDCSRNTVRDTASAFAVFTYASTSSSLFDSAHNAMVMGDLS